MKSTFQRRILTQSKKSTPLSRFVGLSYAHPAEPPGQDLRYWIWFALLSTTWSLSVFFKSHQICMLPGFFSSWLHPVGLGSRQPYPLLKCLQHKNKQNKVPWDGPGLASLEVALWVDCTLLTISLTCHLGSHTPQAAFTDIVTKQRKWCFVELVDVQWKWKDENWNRHTSAVQGAALRTGCHDPLWQSIFWTLLNSSPCSQKRLIFCVKNVFFYWVHWKKWNPKQNEHQMSFNERKKGNQKEVSSQVTPKRALNSCWSWHKSSITRCTCNHLGS